MVFCFVLVSVPLKEQTPLPIFIDWFHQVKTLSCWFPRLMGLPEFSLRAGANQEAVLGLQCDLQFVGLLSGIQTGMDPA